MIYYGKTLSSSGPKLTAAHMTVNGEFYIAPLYNYLIKNGKIIRYKLISNTEILFCGTPKEYEYLINSSLYKNR
jgi:hypothetical protein